MSFATGFVSGVRSVFSSIGQKLEPVGNFFGRGVKVITEKLPQTRQGQAALAASIIGVLVLGGLLYRASQASGQSSSGSDSDKD